MLVEKRTKLDQDALCEIKDYLQETEKLKKQENELLEKLQGIQFRHKARQQYIFSHLNNILRKEEHDHTLSIFAIDDKTLEVLYFEKKD